MDKARKDINIKVINFIRQHELLRETNKVYVATSGGADSMSLLAFMNHYKDIFKIEVAAVHVNHGIRGETARRDAKFVEEYCRSNNIEFVLFDAETDGTIVPENASEEWARQLRYNYFSKLTCNGVKIATAHTLSDQLETVLFRMARGGSGINGMCGIPIKRGAFIRPFLCINRAEVEELVELYGTGNITDETNLGDVYTRNKIRHTVVPVLKQINAGAEESVGKLCERFSKAQQYISKQAGLRLAEYSVIKGIKVKTEAFIGTDEIIIDEMLIQLLRGIGVQSEQIVDVVKDYINNSNFGVTFEEASGELQLNDRYSICISNRYVTIRDNTANKSVDLVEGVNSFGYFGYDVNVERFTGEEFRDTVKTKYDLCKYADTSKLDITKCVIRSRAPGDVFKPACKMRGKLCKFMRNTPFAEREHIPVIEYNEEIIWVWGVGFTDGFTPSAESSEVIKVDWKVVEVAE